MIIVADRYLRALNDFCQMPPILINIKFTKLKTKNTFSHNKLPLRKRNQYNNVISAEEISNVFRFD